MITLLTGPKGTGKTKKLIAMIEDALKRTRGNVVCVEKSDKLNDDVNYKARLVSADHYDISGFDAFYGLLAGLCASDHDITDILVDATLRIGSRDFNELAAFLNKVNKLAEDSDTKFTFTISAEKSMLPEEVYDFCDVN